jgi:hypothetical protein
VQGYEPIRILQKMLHSKKIDQSKTFYTKSEIIMAGNV